MNFEKEYGATLGVMPKQEKDAQLHRITSSKGRKERSSDETSQN